MYKHENFQTTMSSLYTIVKLNYCNLTYALNKLCGEWEVEFGFIYKSIIICFYKIFYNILIILKFYLNQETIFIVIIINMNISYNYYYEKYSKT